jgi:diguanylate cyclase (GGDEF)-like protein
VNEEYGFDEGNRVLSKVAWTLARHARPRDLIIRYAADEFLIVFDTNMPSDVFEERLGQLRSSIRHLSFKELPDLRLTISIGAVDSAGFVADLMARAREQLRQAQQTGDAISLYTGSLASPASTASPASPEEVRL